MSFQNEIYNVPAKWRCRQYQKGKFFNFPNNDCFLGVPPNPIYNRLPLDTIPSETKGFHFYLGSDNFSFIESFCNSEFKDKIQRLYIGTSSYTYSYKSDLKQVVKILSKYRFPNLKRLELGIYQLFHNVNCSYGTLGNITTLLKNIPNVINLGLYGNFDLSEKLIFRNMRKINIWVDDPALGINDGPLKKITLINLLSSTYPFLEKAAFQLECAAKLDNEEGKQKYEFPLVFLSGINIPFLNRLDISGKFKKGEKEKFLRSDLYKLIEKSYICDLL